MERKRFTGKLPKGCKMCIRGEKLVLFATGICPRHCFYCPVSEKKMYKDVTYANEWRIKKTSDLFEEAVLTEAKGAGITGGDPLARPQKTAKFIKLLKKRFGKDFRIHLYTPMELVNPKTMKVMHDAGLDELRLHPDVYNKRLWTNVKHAMKFDWDLGVEIPIVPGTEKQSVELINFFKDKVGFFNLNELEFSEPNCSEYKKKGLKCRGISYAIQGSRELAMKLMNKYAESGLNIHFCTARFKDRTQLGNRIKRRARNVKRKFDSITSEGTLVRGALYFTELKPEIGYRSRLDSLKPGERARILSRLKTIMKQTMRKFKINNGMMAVDDIKLRLLTSPKIARQLVHKTELEAAIVEEYPTWDALELSVEFL